jgi:hypothetical protein
MIMVYLAKAALTFAASEITVVESLGAFGTPDAEPAAGFNR